MRDEAVIEAPVDRDLLTKRYTEAAVAFIEQNRERPFFLYLPHAMPGSTHRPYASEAFRGQSANGPYGDSVEEIDWSTGEILEAIKRQGIDGNTLVIWTSDNGAPHRDPPQGSNEPLSGWGYTTMEGGMRVPCIARWPGKIPAAKTCDELCTLMDMLPTFARLAGGETPIDRKIDGHDIWPLLTATPAAKTPHAAFYYYHMDQLQAVRDNRWKLHLGLSEKRTNLRDATATSDARLYDLANDIGETTNVAAANSEVVQRLQALAELARQDLGDRDRPGAAQRPVGRIEPAVPQLLRR
jgi:arylsulfatase A-like enzyme